MNNSELIEQMEIACLKASKAIRSRLSAGSIEVSRKADKSLVLNVDLESQASLFSDLGGLGPLLSEEDPKSHAHLGAARFISIDPLDGTSACKRYPSAKGGQVGFGPLLGLYEQGRLVAAVYANIPTAQLFRAEAGNGVYVSDLSSEPGQALNRRRLQRNGFPPLSESAVLFYTGKLGEMRIVEALRREAMIETAYRFGGFANDCSRLAQGFEDAMIQFYAKVWDFPAALFSAEAGLGVLCDPLGKAKKLSDWQVQMENPVLIAAEEHLSALLTFSRKALIF